MALVLEWAAVNREELRLDWERARLGTPTTTDRATRVGADMKLVRIREVKPMGGHRVQLTLTDGRTGPC
jgi:DUF971 family protein